MEGRIIFFFSFLVFFVSTKKWDCEYLRDTETAFRRDIFDLSWQNGNTSNGNQFYEIVNSYGDKPHQIYRFFLCETISNPFSVSDSDCIDEDNTIVCGMLNKKRKHQGTSQQQDFAIGEPVYYKYKEPYSSEMRNGTLVLTASPATHRDHENLQQLVQLEISCPYPGHKNGDYGTVRIEDDSHMRTHILPLYLDGVCEGPLCCTYQDDSNPFHEAFSVCGDKYCPKLEGFSVLTVDPSKCAHSCKAKEEIPGPFCCTYQNPSNASFSLCTEETSCPPVSGFGLTLSTDLRGLDCAGNCVPESLFKCCMYHGDLFIYQSRKKPCPSHHYINNAPSFGVSYGLSTFCTSRGF